MIDFAPPPLLLTPSKPAIIRASRLPEPPAEARGISTRPYLGLGASFASLLMSGGAAAATATLIGAEGIGTDLTTYNFTNAGAHFNLSGYQHCLVLAANRAGSNRTLSSHNVGGVTTGTELVDTNPTSATGIHAVIVAVAGMVSPSAIDVSLTLSGGASRAGVAVYGCNGLIAPTVLVDGPDMDNNDPFSTTMNVSAGGFAIGFGFANGGPTAITWTNLDPDVIVLEAAWEASGVLAAASREFASEQVGATFQGDWTGSAGAGASNLFLSMR
jgi:hypothetical protein